MVVETAAHAIAAAAAVRIESPLVRAGRLAVAFRFPYSYKLNARNKPPFAWDHADKHRTILARSGAGFAEPAILDGNVIAVTRDGRVSAWR